MKLAYLYPGQGVQTLAMGKELYNTYKECKELIDLSEDVLKINLKHLLLEEDERINRTEFTQLGIFIISMCMTKVLDTRGMKADIVAGLSLGEYSALVACGALEYTDALKIIQIRGKLMENTMSSASTGMCSVIGLEAQEVEIICNSVFEELNKIVSIANYNSPSQVVISGDKIAVEHTKKRLTDIGAKGLIDLNVSGAFHTKLLYDTSLEFKELISKYNFNMPNIPYVTNIDAEVIYTSEGIKESLVKQLYSPVKWQQSMETIIALNCREFIEVGPKTTLTGFLKKIDRSLVISHASKYLN